MTRTRTGCSSPRVRSFSLRARRLLPLPGLLMGLLGASASAGLANEPPVVDPIPDQALLEGGTLVITATAFDPDGDPVIFSYSPLLPWITQAGQDFILTPGFDVAGPGGATVSVTIHASDGLSEGTTTFDVHVLNLTSAANTPYAARTWHGVNVAGGEVAFSSGTDIALGGPMRLSFGRYYASLLEREGETAGTMGRNWLGTYDWRLVETAADARVVDNRGRVYRFVPGRGGWELDDPLDAPWQLTDLGTEMAFVHVRHRMFYILDRTSGKLSRIVDRSGNQLVLSYAAGLLQSVSDGLGRSLTFVHDGSGRVIEVSDGTRTVGYGYTGSDLTAYTDAAGKPTTYLYDSASGVPGLLTGWIDAVGNSPLGYVYDGSGLVSEVHDPLTTLASFTVLARTETGSVIEVMAPDGGLHRYTHDGFGRLTEYRDPAGGPTGMSYDARGRLLALTRPSGIQPAQFAYDPVDGFVNTITLGDGEQILIDAERRTFPEGYFLFGTAVTAPDLAQIQLSYDQAGNLDAVTDQAGHSWTMTHDAAGRITSITNPTLGVFTYAYDSLGRLESRNDGAGTTTYAYDPLDRLITTSLPDQSTRVRAYDVRNRLTSFTNELNKTWTFEYRDNGQLHRGHDPLGVTTEITYDAMNRPVQAGVPASGSVSTFVYDPSWRVESVTDPTSRAMTYTYDQLGRLAAVSDPDGEVTGFDHDADGRLTAIIDPLTHTWSYGYDLRDRLAGETDPLGRTTTYTYDAVGNLLVIARPLGLNHVLDYDVRGLLTGVTLGPVSTGYSYTPLGLLDTYTDGEQNVWDWSYDVHGRLQSITDPLSRTISYVYDSRNRLTDVTHPEGSASYDYDAAGRLVQSDYSDGTVMSYTYDDVGRLLTTNGVSRTYDDIGRTVTENGLVFEYDEAGRLLSETLGPGREVTHAYDLRGLPSATTDWLGGTTTFDHDAAGRLTGIERPNGTSAAYRYDDANRLVGLTELKGTLTAGSVSLVRDALGRVTSAAREFPHTWVPTASDRTFSYDDASQVVGFSYDGLGRLLSDGLRSYVWNGASLPDTVHDGSETRSVDPDGLGRIKVAMPSLDPSTPYVRFVYSPNGGPGVPALPAGLAGGSGGGHGGLGNRAGTRSVLAPVPAAGGRDAEEASPYHTRASERLRHKDRAVSIRDYEPLASGNPVAKVSRAIASPEGPGVDTDHWITTPAGLLLHVIDLRGVPPTRRYFHFDDRGNTAFLSDEAGNPVSAYAYTVQGEVSRIGEMQHYPRRTFGAAFGMVEESGDGLYRLGSSFYDAKAPDAVPRDRPGADIDAVTLSKGGTSFEASHRLKRGRKSRTFLGATIVPPMVTTVFRPEGVPIRASTGSPRPAMKIRPLHDRVLVKRSAPGEERPVLVLAGGRPLGSPQVVVGGGTWGDVTGGAWGDVTGGAWGGDVTGAAWGDVTGGVWGGDVTGGAWGHAPELGLGYSRPLPGSMFGGGGHEVGHWLGMRPPAIVPLVPPILDDRPWPVPCDECDDED